nr:hypothetical protein [Tanacetum cinerariifolium]
MVTRLGVWYFRKDGSAFDPHIVYADHPEVFPMKLFHGGTFTPTPNRRALASDDDIVYLSKFVKDNKVIEVYIEHGETTVESYYMPTFTEKLQLKELNNNDEVVELDEELPIVSHTRKMKFLGIPKCRNTLAIKAYKEMLWNCSIATTITQFNRGRAHYDLLINNICEVFNRKLLDDRNSPIITCRKYVKEYLMKRIVIVQSVSVIEKSVGPLTPSVTKVFNKIKEKVTQYNVGWHGGDLYQVKGPYDDQARGTKNGWKLMPCEARDDFYTIELHQISTFYNALTQADQDSLNVAADGNLLNRTPRDALTIIENKSKVRISRNKPIVSKVSTTTSPSPSPDVIALTEIVKELVLMNKATQQAIVKAIKRLVSCGKGAHYGYNCSPKVPIIFNLEPCHDQNIEEFPKTLPSSHPICYSEDENSFAYDSTPNLVKDSLNVFNLPSQPSMYSYEFCRDDAYYSYDCPPKESDEFIKSSVENLVPDPSESEDERNLFKPSFDEEIISIKIDPHHLNAESDLIESLLNQDSSIIYSSMIDSLLDEFTGELILLKLIPPGIDEADCDPEEEIHLIEKLLYDNSSPRPLEEFISKNSDDAIESFSPFPIPIDDSDSLRDEIDLSLTPDDLMPSGIEDDDYDSEGDILEELLSNNSLLLPENKSFHFDIPLSPRPPVKPLDDD